MFSCSFFLFSMGYLEYLEVKKPHAVVVFKPKTETHFIKDPNHKPFGKNPIH